MPKLNHESHQTYLDRVVNPISPTFCGAKWYNATIWLGSGMTTSCHHPPAHSIDKTEILTNVNALHNTPTKKAARQDMINGIQTPECEYCWKIENLNTDTNINTVSDRAYKSMIYSDEELREAAEMGANTDVNLKTLEIAFDSVCNFACSYCNSAFSTTWMTDIKTHGPYVNLISDGAMPFRQDGQYAIPYGLKNKDNPYVSAFMKWWESDLQYSLTELRITGGEATMSNDFWQLIDWWKVHPECKVRLAVNSNLGTSNQLINRLAAASHNFSNFQLYTSNESFGNHAEYIRDGLVWQTWLDNITYMLSYGKIEQLHIMMTINILCLFSITEFMDEMIQIKKKFGTHHASMSFNILRFPSFQSISTLPQHLRNDRADILEKWLFENWDNSAISKRGRGMLLEEEYTSIVRLISYIRNNDISHSGASTIASRQRDFKNFFTQYDKRRGKDFSSTFPDLKEWWDSLPITRTFVIKSIR
jgi:pyruvate-formate lyase-activating enzyme